MKTLKRRKAELRKKGKKGFTLVELIVVIVILGILAAIAIPALVGYIDKARNDGAITEAATARTALQTIASDAYGRGGNYQSSTGAAVNDVLDPANGNTGTNVDGVVTEVNRLIGKPLTGTTDNYSGLTWTVTAGQVGDVTITVPSGPEVKYTASTNTYEIIP